MSEQGSSIVCACGARLDASDRGMLEELECSKCGARTAITPKRLRDAEKSPSSAPSLTSGFTPPIVFRTLAAQSLPAVGELWLRSKREREAPCRALATLVLEQGLDALVQGTGAVEWLVVPSNPSLDEMLAASLTRALLTCQPIPPFMAFFASYAALVGEGQRPSSLHFEETLEAMFLIIRSERGEDLTNPVVSSGFLRSWDSMFARFVQAAEIMSNPFRTPLFNEQERASLIRDLEVYRQDVINSGERWHVQLPGGPPTSSGLLLRSPRSRLLSEWSRCDRNAPVGEGYLFLAVNWGRGQWVFSTDPVMRLSLKPLAELLQKLEPLPSGSANTWYDGRDDGHTRIAAPLGGTRLPEVDVLQVVRQWTQARQIKPRLLDEVQFTVYRPKTIRPQVWYPLLAFTHLAERRPDAPADEPDPIQQVREQAKQVLGAKAKEFRDTSVDARQAIPQEGEITLLPDVPGIEFNPERRMFRWLESVDREEFRLRASAGLDGQVARGRLSAYLGAVLLAEVTLAIKVDSTHQESKEAEPAESITARPYRKIFASYSHQDAEIVRQYEWFVETLGDQYLRDVRDLRAGEDWNEALLRLIEQADVFQLFWSKSAMSSPYVRREWEYALSLNRASFIRPTYWEEPLPQSPDGTLPPDVLRRLHFHRIAFDLKAPPPALPSMPAGNPSPAWAPAPGRSARKSSRSYLSFILAACLLAVLVIPFWHWVGDSRLANEESQLAKLQVQLQDALTAAKQATENKEQEIAKLRGDLLAAKQTLANLYLTTGDYNRAIASLHELIKLDPNADAFASMGEAYLRKKEFQKAIESYARAIRLDPKDSKALKGRGLALAQMKDYSAAISDLKAALALDPRDVPTLETLGELSFTVKDPKKAEQYYQQALAIRKQTSSDPKAQAINLYNLGRIYLEDGRLDLAERALKDSLAYHEEELGSEPEGLAIVLSALGKVFVAKQDDKMAEAFFERSLKIFEKNGAPSLRLVNMLTSYAALLRRTGRADQANALEDRARKIQSQLDR